MESDVLCQKPFRQILRDEHHQPAGAERNRGIFAILHGGLTAACRRFLRD